MKALLTVRRCATGTRPMDNATKKMVLCDAPGFKVDYGSAYALPRIGKDIVVTKWTDNGKKTQKTLKWNGRRFTK